MTNEQREINSLKRINQMLQTESAKIQVKQRLVELKHRARNEALQKATFLDYHTNGKTAEAVKKEADKLYLWLIKDLK